jgi:serine/threonine protein kinase
MVQPSSRLSLSFKIGDQPVPGYRLVRELGRGTFGVVWLAVTENGFERALKLVNLEQKGGKKEFRALRLIKDRKILHGNLLTLIDYWLLDRDGNILASPASVTLDTHVAPAKLESAGESGLALTTEPTPTPVIDRAAVLKGTMIPGAAGFESTAVNSRDTYQSSRPSDAPEEENSHAIWLVVAMELGHKTLHDRQKEFSQNESIKSPTKLSRRGATQVDKKEGTSPGSKSASDAHHDHQGAEEDELSPMPADEILPYMEQAARGLDYLHRCEIVHRDVKPQNIMLVGDVAKVCDYGLASELGDMRATTNAFTLPYAAPDAINNRPVPASDQYSLAVTYIELRTGRWPFVSNTSTAVYAAKETGVHYLKFVPKRNVRQVLKKALAKNPAERYATCGEFVKQLTKAEHAKSSAFAMVQVALASLAIIFVLLAAAATHPDVHGPILVWLDQYRSTDVEEFARRLKVAEAMLTDEKPQAAAAEFESLQKLAPLLPESATTLKYDTVLGVARAHAGMPTPAGTAEGESQVQELLAGLTIHPDIALDERQRLQQYYLQVVSKQNPISIGGMGPDSPLAQSALSHWERALWARALQAPGKTPGIERIPPNLKEALNRVVAQRKAALTPETFAAAEDAFKQLMVDARETLAEDDEFWQAIKLEELHLATRHPERSYEQNLRALDALLADRLQQDRQLASRGQILRLLILADLKRPQTSFFDPVIYQTITATDGAIPALQDSPDSPFSGHEFNAVRDLQLLFKSEIRDALQPIPADAYPALLSLCGKRESFDLLRQRVRKHLDDKSLGDQRLAAVQAAWGDLNTLLSDDLKLDASERAELADLRLSVAFADPSAKPMETLQEFLAQVRESRQGEKWMRALIDRASNDAAWLEPALPILKSLSQDPTNDLAVSKEFDRLRMEANNLSLGGLLNVDLSTPAEVAQLLARLDNAADQAHPLPSLARLECEILTAEQSNQGKLKAEQIKTWLAQLRTTLDRVDAGDSSLIAYGLFLRARLLATSDQSFEREEAGNLVVELLQKPELPSWFTASRKQGAGNILGLVALSALDANDSDILQFHLLDLKEQKDLAEIQAVVAKAGLQAKSLLAVAAIVEATHAEQTDWNQVLRNAKACQQDPATIQLLQTQGRLRLLDYVEALASLRLAPTDQPLPPDVILNFQRLLYARDGDKAKFFQFSGAASPDDSGVFRNLVIPVVAHPSLASQTAVLPEAKVALGAIWGAKGRLLQRSNTVVVHDPMRKSDKRDTTTVALVLAHDAFRRARELQPSQIDYVVGFGRTLTELPSTDTDPEKRAEQVANLVEQYDPKGNSDNLGMLLLGAYVRRFQAREQATREQQLAFSLEAIRRYERVLDGSQASDPFEVRNVCLEGLSDTHLRQAFWISKVTASEVAKLLARDTPPVESKAYHLREAAENAQEAIRITDRPQQENAYNALGNAYEDMAFYLGMSEYYPQSVSAFETGIRAADQEERIAARAKMNLGRCLCRYGRDFLSGLSEAKRAETLQRAIASLTESLAEAPQRNNLRAETFYWRATSRAALVAYEPARAEELLKQAENDLSEAKDIAREVNSAETNYYQVEQIRVAQLLNDASQNPVQKTAALQRAQNMTDEMFARASADPKKFSVTTLSMLVSQSRQTFPTDPAKMLRWLPASGPLHQQWRSGDAYRAEAVKLYLMSAVVASRPDDEKEAIVILKSIADAQIKAVANASVLLYQADRQMRTMRAQEERYRAIATKTDADRKAIQKEAQKTYEKFREAFAAHEATFDPDTAALMDEINDSSLDKIRADKFKRRTNIERRAIVNQVMGASIGLRDTLYTLASGLARAESDPAAVGTRHELLRVAHDCIKPIFFLDEKDYNEPLRTKITDAKAKYGRLLETRERELVELGDKFD